MPIKPQNIDPSFRLREEAGEWRLEVADVGWDGHTPFTVWKRYRRWARRPTPERLAQAKARALANRALFPVCQFCGETCLPGQMHNRKACHGCATIHCGIVY